MRGMSIKTAAVAALAVVGVHGQPADGREHFEVASLKLSSPAAGSPSMRSDPGRIDYKNVFLRDLLIVAYRVAWYQLPQDLNPTGPNSRLDCYDVAATFPPGTTKEQTALMLQALLAERLNLRIHRETKQFPAYVVVVAKSGLLIHRAEKGTGTAGSTGIQSAAFGKSGTFIRGKISVSLLVGLLARSLNRPMFDLTGLEGDYDIRLECRSDDPAGAGSGVLTEDSGVGTPSASTPSGAPNEALFRSMEKQLGLKVEVQKRAIEMLVIDHLERFPAEN